MEHPDKSQIGDVDAGHPRVLILGGGFAGVWAAIAAAQTAAAHARGVQIDLVSPSDQFVPRPRLYEADPVQTTLALKEILEPRGIGHIHGRAVAIDQEAQTVAIIDRDGAERDLPFDRLVLATGSQLKRPPIDDTHLHNIDTLGAAEALDDRLAQLHDGATVVVVGAGFTGIELACELPARVPSAHIVLLERADEIAPEMGPHPRPVIQAALDELNIDTRTSVTITGYDGTTVELADGSSFQADVVVWTAGLSASPLAASVSTDLDSLGRLRVDQRQRVQDTPAVFAAGDTAAPLDDSGHTVAQSAQHSMPQGQFAGHNAVADICGAELRELSTLPYGTCLDLGAAGAVFTEGWDRAVKLVGDDAKALKRDINTVWLYPAAV
ncbi:MAG: FAD-dependent oxidoreductase [Actinomycetota bacterium]